MALGKAVISTTIGAEGINYTNNENIMIADDVESTVDAIRQLATDRNKCDTIGQNARTLIFKDHDNKILIEGLVRFYNEVRKD